MGEGNGLATVGLLDTNFIVRYLINDPPEMAEVAARVIDGLEVAVDAVAIVETAHVLSKVYRVAREELVDALVRLLQKDNVSTLGVSKPIMIDALLLCRPSGRVSFPDAAMWAEARSNGVKLIYTFDKQFPSEGVALRGGD